MEYKKGRVKDERLRYAANSAPRRCASKKCFAATSPKARCTTASKAQAEGRTHGRNAAEGAGYVLEMHDYYRRGYTPKVKPSKACNACSLKEVCMPKLMKDRPVREYLRKAMEVEP